MNIFLACRIQMDIFQGSSDGEVRRVFSEEMRKVKDINLKHNRVPIVPLVIRKRSEIASLVTSP